MNWSQLLLLGIIDCVASICALPSAGFAAVDNRGHTLKYQHNSCWHRLPTLRHPRTQTTLISSDDGRLFCIGGAQSACVEVLEVGATEWTFAASMLSHFLRWRSLSFSQMEKIIRRVGWNSLAGPMNICVQDGLNLRTRCDV